MQYISHDVRTSLFIRTRVFCTNFSFLTQSTSTTLRGVHQKDGKVL